MAFFGRKPQKPGSDQIREEGERPSGTGGETGRGRAVRAARQGRANRAARNERGAR